MAFNYWLKMWAAWLENRKLNLEPNYSNTRWKHFRLTENS